MDLLIPVSIGELLDKISILELKKKNITSEDKLILVNTELDALMAVLHRHAMGALLEEAAYKDLKEINAALWDVSERRREFEAAADFNHVYIDYSRLEYKLNDRRAAAKHRINRMHQSRIMEVKSYSVD